MCINNSTTEICLSTISRFEGKWMPYVSDDSTPHISVFIDYGEFFLARIESWVEDKKDRFYKILGPVIHEIKKCKVRINLIYIKICCGNRIHIYTGHTDDGYVSACKRTSIINSINLAFEKFYEEIYPPHNGDTCMDCSHDGHTFQTCTECDCRNCDDKHDESWSGSCCICDHYRSKYADEPSEEEEE